MSPPGEAVRELMGTVRRGQGWGSSAEETLKTMRQPLKNIHGKMLIFFSGFLGSGKMTFLWKNFSFQ